jgi:hypothetical protein
MRKITAVMISVAGVFLFATPAFAGVGGSVVPDYPTPVTVGQTGLSATLTISNSSTGANTAENISVSNISHAPSCGSTANTTCQLANADTGVFTVHNGVGRVGTACAATTFTASAPDASGNITFTPSIPLVLGPASGPLSGSQCIIDFTVDVLRVPTVDAAGAAGIQTAELGSAQFLGQTSGLNGTGSGSTQTTINKASPGIATLLSNLGPVLVGTSVSDSATLSSSTPTAGGTVTYTVYTNSACSAGAQTAGTKVVTNGIVPNSDPIMFNTAGTFDWQAVYSGDANNNPATSTCQTETLVVNKATPTISTVLSTTTAMTGTSVHDTATLASSTPTAGGSVTYTVYSDNSCSAGAQDAGTKVVTNSIVPNSNAIVFNTAGTFYWQVVYSGDANNNAATSTCTEEIVTIIEQKGHIIVDKITDPALDLTSFAFNATGTGYVNFNLADADTPNNQELSAGTYGVSEITPAGWTLTSFTCSSSLGGSENPSAIILSPGETVTCTALNTKQVVVQYCSPGYWKQSQHIDSYVGYFPTTLFSSVFADAFPGKNLVQVLSTGGGGLVAFGRATVGGLLNASALNAGTTTAGVIATFNSVYANAPSGNTNGYYGAAQSLFTAPHNCPLN